MCTRAIEDVVKANAGLAWKLAGKYARGDNSRHWDDILQEATIGLWRAAESFDPSYGTQFSTHAAWQIKACIIRWLHTGSRLIYVPPHRWYDKARDMPGDALMDMDVPMKFVAASEADHVEQLAPNHVRSQVVSLLGQLKPRWAQVLRMRFGIGCEPMSLVKAGKVLGVTRERVRQIETKALARLARLAPQLREWL